MARRKFVEPTLPIDPVTITVAPEPEVPGPANDGAEVAPVQADHSPSQDAPKAMSTNPVVEEGVNKARQLHAACCAFTMSDTRPEVPGLYRKASDAYHRFLDGCDPTTRDAVIAAWSKAHRCSKPNKCEFGKSLLKSLSA